MIRVLALSSILIGILAAPVPAHAYWPPEGRYLGSSGNFPPTSVSLSGDGSGGVVALWRGSTNAKYYGYAARVSPTGDLLWSSPGYGGQYPIYNSTYDSHSYPDGSGGAFVTTFPSTFAGPDTAWRLHHLLPGGGVDPAWPATGQAVGRTFSIIGFYVPWVQHDGAGGALVVARAPKSNGSVSDTLVVRHVLANGDLDPVWPARGLRINDPSQPLFLGSVKTALGVPDGTGGGIVVWLGDRLRVQRVTASGTIAPGWPVGGLALRDVAYSSDESPPMSAVIPSGPDHYFVAWTEGWSGHRSIWLQRFHRDGTLAPGWPSSAKHVYTYSYVDQSSSLNARMISDGSTGVYVSWVDGVSRPRGVRFLADGSLAPGWSAEGLVLSDPGSPPQGTYGGCCGNVFDIANGADSGLAVIWRDNRNDAGRWLLRTRWLLADGSPDPNHPASGVTVNPGSDDSTWPTAVSGGQGGVYVAWLESFTQGFYSNTMKLAWQPYDPSLVGVEPTPAARGTMPRAWPNPARGELHVELALATGSPARLELLDLAGRRIRSLELDGSGPRIAKLANLGDVAPGVYLLRVVQGGTNHTARVAIVR